MRSMNEIEVGDGYDDTKQTTLRILPLLEQKGYTKEEIEKFSAIIENVPDRSTFIHGDAHIGNVMLQDGEYLFIDLGSSGKGHPIFDMASMFMIYRLGQNITESERKESIHLKNFTLEEIQLIWNTYVKNYLGTDDEKFIEKVSEQLKAVASVRFLLAEIAMPNIFSKEN